MHLYNLLRVLKRYFSSSDETKQMEIEANCRELCRKSFNQDIEKWLIAWKQIYIINKAYKMIEMADKRSVRDFIYSFMNKDKA